MSASDSGEQCLKKSENSSDLENKPKKVKPLTQEEVELYNATIEKSGVVYIARIPPFMKPQKIKHLMSNYGTIGRVYLKKEDEKVRKRRKMTGGNKRISYVEGWIEFEDKRVAKNVVMMLNNNPMGETKNDRYHNDLWSLKYLPKFKWHNLSEKAVYQRSVRQNKLALSISKTTRENNIYLENVKKNKILNKIKESRKKKALKKNLEMNL